MYKRMPHKIVVCNCAPEMRLTRVIVLVYSRGRSHRVRGTRVLRKIPYPDRIGETIFLAPEQRTSRIAHHSRQSATDTKTAAVVCSLRHIMCSLRHMAMTAIPQSHARSLDCITPPTDSSSAVTSNTTQGRKPAPRANLRLHQATLQIDSRLTAYMHSVWGGG